MKDNFSISVVIPLYNEEENIEELYKRLKLILDSQTKQYEIIFVDDGSIDESVAKIKSLREKDNNIKVISLSRNYGHQIALSAGLDKAVGDIVITMDADLQHPPELIPKLIKEWQNGADIVSAVKTTLKLKGRSLFISFFAGIFYKLMTCISDIEIDPRASDFRLLSRKAVNAICSMPERTRFLRGLVKWIGFSSAKVYYEPAERFAGSPKATFRKLISFAAAGIFSFSTLPLRVALYLGLFATFICIAYACYALYAHLFLNITPPGWTSVLVTVIFIGGVQLIILGVIGEYIAKIFQEVKHRPLYIIRESIGFEEK